MLVIGLAISACSSNGDDGDQSVSATSVESDGADDASEPTDPVGSEAPSGTDEPAPGDSSAPEQDVEADTAAAEAAVLTLGDFPSGWQEEAPSDEESEGQAELDQARAECVGGSPGGLLEGDARAEAGDFVGPDGVTVSQAVLVTASDEEADALFDGFVDPEAPACLAAVYNDQIDNLLGDDAPDDLEIGEITVEAVDVVQLGDETTGLRIITPISSEGVDVDLVLDLVLTRAGRTLSGLSFESTDAPVPPEQIAEYATLAASRLPGATSG